LPPEAGCRRIEVVRFELKSEFQPTGDQPVAIRAIVDSLNAGNRYQTLLGVTGSGKTFTMANVIAEVQRPTLIISHNKTLAAQLYSEFKNFFPGNAVEYFVSYYDYYQPEAYIPQTDTFIEKDSSINDEIERLRIAATSSLISRHDVIVIASVSCIYGLGSPEDFSEMMIRIEKGKELGRDILLERLVENLYERNDVRFERGQFRVRGDVVDVFPAYMETAIRIEFWGDDVDAITELNPLTGETGSALEQFHLYPANQFITPRLKLENALGGIRKELDERVSQFEKDGHLLEAQRIRMRTEYDLEMMREMGFCSGIENYSRHLSGRKAGDRPWCLIDFFPEDLLLIIDESHATVPQIGAMYRGDRSRKERLVEHGFRLPSALDNRPLRFEEFSEVTGQTIFVSATPSGFELERSEVIAEQVIRPTGLLDPVMQVRPAQGQVEDLIGEVRNAVQAGERVLVTTLTKRMSEDLTTYLREREIRVEYLHSDIDVIERIEILRNLRQGDFDVLVGINLLREGLDLPEVALVAILDADKEGFLRSETSLIQTAGRAARHLQGRVILYADRRTNSMQKTLDVTSTRRERQLEYNETHGVTPRSVERAVQASLHYREHRDAVDPVSVAEALGDEDVAAVIAEIESEMLEAAENLEFEKAALLRDQLEVLRGGDFRKSESARTRKRSKRVHRGKTYRPRRR
jgi:excinuclease ABC subunit B